MRRQPCSRHAIEKMLNERDALLSREYSAALDLACFGARDTILDVATGSGRMLLQILMRGHSVVSGDIDREALERARERLGDLSDKPELVVMDAHKLQFDDGSFTAVTLANAIHEMDGPGGALDEITRVLTADGKLLVVEFNSEGFDLMELHHQIQERGQHPRGEMSTEDIDRYLTSVLGWKRKKERLLRTVREQCHTHLTLRRGSMVPIIDQMIERYLFVSEYLRDHPDLAGWRHSNNAQPAFTDAEVITIGLMQGALGVDTLKKTYHLMAANFREWFPRLISYQQWLARLHALSEVIGRLVWASVQTTGHELRVYVFDSKPIPVCKPIRHGRVRSLREEGAYWGMTHAGWFFGFKLHVLIHISGVILDAVLTPGHFAEGAVALRLSEAIGGGVGLGDTSYGGQPVRAALADEADLVVVTPGTAGKGRKRLISQVRERIETVFSDLWRAFVDRVFSRSWEGLWNTIKLKLLAYNLGHQGIVSQ